VLFRDRLLLALRVPVAPAPPAPTPSLTAFPLLAMPLLRRLRLARSRLRGMRCGGFGALAFPVRLPLGALEVAPPFAMPLLIRTPPAIPVAVAVRTLLRRLSHVGARARTARRLRLALRLAALLANALLPFMPSPASRPPIPLWQRGRRSGFADRGWLLRGLLLFLLEPPEDLADDRGFFAW
jgi:hypothetical protein